MARTDIERFIIVTAEILNTEISNDDPFRFTKRKMKEIATESLANGILQAEESMRLIKNLDLDLKEFLTSKDC